MKEVNPFKSSSKAARKSVLKLLLAAGLLILLNIVSSYVFFRLDLTSDKRYKLSESSKQLATELKDVVYFKIYLDGDIPPGFRRLKNATREMLDEFKVYAGDHIEYEFVDPSANVDDKERNQVYKQLNEKGLTPTQLESREKGSRSQYLIFPGAIVSHGSQEIPVQLLKSRIGSNADAMLNSSIENLEFEIATTLRKLSTPVAKRVGFLRGHGELNTRQITDAARALSDFYRVDTVNIEGKLGALSEHEALIIAKPQESFSEKDKFILDQYIMKGGKVLWLIDKMQISMDSLMASNTNVALPLELNLDDQLFNYGVRINNDLLMDLQAAPIPVVTGYVGNQPKQDLFPWYYFPLLTPQSKHPVVNNLNAIKAEFISSLDTIETNSVKKTILLTSSEFSRVQMPPARVSLNILESEPDPKLFNKKQIPVAVLLEGNFRSAFRNRIPQEIRDSPEIDYSENSAFTKMIVISDGDIIASHVSKRGTIFPLGFDRYTQQNYGNKNFILNCMDYLLDETGILELRGKEFKMRMLDPTKVKDAGMLKWMNVILPVLLIAVYGLIRNAMRRRKYAK